MPPCTRGCVGPPRSARARSPPIRSSRSTSRCMRACSVTDLLRLVRAGNLLVAAAGVLAGGWVALGAIAVPRLLGFAAVAAVGFGAAGNALNDLRDVAADRVNRPGGERPVAAGRLRRETAHLVAAAGSFIGVAMAALVSGTALLVGIAALVVIAAYSPLLKPAGVAGNVAIAAVAGLPLWFGAFAVGRPAAGVVPWVLAAWIHLVREIVKDIEDEPGDRAAGRRTLPVLSAEHVVRGDAQTGVRFRAGWVEASLHVATLGSVLVLYGRRLWQIARGVLRRDPGSVRYAGLLILATIPAGLIGVLSHRQIEERFHSLTWLGVQFLITGGILWTTRGPRGERDLPTPAAATGIGFAQAVAILPAISRSGATVAAALWSGLTPVAAAEFSFLMAIPVIAGAALVEAREAVLNLRAIGLLP